MICELLFDARQRILLIRMGPALTREALQFMQAALGRFRAAHGHCPGILDLTATEQVAVPVADLVALAKYRPVMAGTRRIFVAANDVMYGLCRMVGAYQDLGGNAPDVVRSLAEAYAILGIADAAFVPFEAM
jgi:hypothetical protein